MKRPFSIEDFERRTSRDVSQVLKRMSGVSKELALASEILQEHVGSLLEAGEIEPSHSTAVAFQDLDRICQVLNDLASLQLELASHTNGNLAPSGPLAASMRLESLTSHILNNYETTAGDDEFWS